MTVECWENYRERCSLMHLKMTELYSEFKHMQNVNELWHDRAKRIHVAIVKLRVNTLKERPSISDKSFNRIDHIANFQSTYDNCRKELINYRGDISTTSFGI